MSNSSSQIAKATTLKTGLFGFQLLADPLLNKGTAFTERERDMFDLHGFLPPNIGTLDEQVSRRLQALRGFESTIEKYAFLRDLQDTNETLFFALLVQNLEELLPVVYTPTVGAGCEQFSKLFRKPRGIFLSPPHVSRMDRILAHPRFDTVEAIVVTDGERILGLGDQGAGGMGISIGKLSLYTGCGGLHPATTLPVMLDVGTDNPDRLQDPLYIGWRHERIRGQEYDDFVDAFVSSVKKRWPHVLLQWEDFAKGNATRFLSQYRDQLCTFNDDVQGTAAVATGTLLSAINVTGVPLGEQRIVVMGAGSAGCGIAGLIRTALVDAGLSDEDAGKRFFMVDREGLLVEGMENIATFQLPFLQPQATTNGWTLDHPDRIALLDVVRNAKPTVLIGVSGQAGVFSEAVVRMMSKHNERPVIFPLSNPTSHAEATPADIDAWSDGKAVIGTGSPFPPLMKNGKQFKVAQTNNSYIFPGVGLGAIAVRARHISDQMFMSAAKALASASPAQGDPEASLLPPVSALREVAISVAIAVARQALDEGLTEGVEASEIENLVHERVWDPLYLPYDRDSEAD
ncbi:malate dehydrogenase (oxaloacetate-decarboxylating) [Paraburkholderia sp. GAS199]|uniref:NAD-dependent malic enzyme n=1 Tax=Paraburkholderia sp. GAS199 TaxID=3035126 RepID=UPI003D1B93C3